MPWMLYHWRPILTKPRSLKTTKSILRNIDTCLKSSKIAMTIPSKTKSLALHSRFLPWYVSGLLLRNGSLSLSLSRH